MNDRVSLDRLTVFSFLLASAAIFEQAKWDRWASSPAELIVSGSAFWLVLHPRSLPALVILLLSVIWDVLQSLPWVSNHSLLAAVAAMTVLVALASRIRADGWPPEREKWFDSFAPAVRIEVVLLYVWAFFHKLNAGWFDPEVSCAVVLADVLGGRLGLPHADWLQEAAIFAALAAEAAIPVLLLVPRTRAVGVLVAVGFHWFLGIATFFNFSAGMYALLFVFLPLRSTALLRRWLTSLRSRAFRIASPAAWRRSYAWASRALPAAAVVVLLYHATWSFRPRGSRFLTAGRLDIPRSLVSHGFEALWWVYGAAVLVILLLLLFSHRRIDGAPGFEMRPRLLALFPLFVLLNGAAPYLGLKTENTFSMFSNLRTEAGYANHLILDGGVRLVDYQDDLVYMESSSDEELSRLAKTGYALPYFEFRSYVSRKVRAGTAGSEPIRITYVRGDRRVDVADAARERELAEPDRWLARKLLWFRPVFTGVSPPCTH
jgi:hypothetical protein